MTTRPTANITAKRDEWMPLIVQYASTRSTAEMPSLEAEFGPGHWKVDSNRQRITQEGLLRYYVYWLDNIGRHHRIGTFDAPAVDRPPGKRGIGDLTLGFDECGRRLVRCRYDKLGGEFFVVAVEWEVVRKCRVPRPLLVPEELALHYVQQEAGSG